MPAKLTIRPLGSTRSTTQLQAEAAMNLPPSRSAKPLEQGALEDNKVEIPFKELNTYTIVNLANIIIT